MKLLFIGDSWLGSNARSMREALARQPDVLVEEIYVDASYPTMSALPYRALNRLLRPLRLRRLEAEIVKVAESFRPDVIVFYKGGSNGAFVRALRRAFAPVVNIFPDYSPHAFGPVIKDAMGAYDLVISTKPFFPANWRRLYGYSNRCVTVLHGYSPTLHYRAEPPTDFRFDIGIVAAARPEYAELMQGVAAKIGGRAVKVVVGGANWHRYRATLPDHWELPGEQFGHSYVEWLRRAKIVIAPIHTRVVVDGKRQPGDVDTSRSYQLAAAQCFFIHRRTDFIKTIYDERSEVPMYDHAGELAEQILYYLGRDERRHAMVAAAHARAVPAYSFDARATEVLGHLETL